MDCPRRFHGIPKFNKKICHKLKKGEKDYKRGRRRIRRKKNRTMVKVKVAESSMVAPDKATPRRKLWLSLANFDYSTIILYFKPESFNGDVGNFFSPELLKESLSKALVLFYPLAGRAVAGENGRREIDCTGEGALFVVARSESTLDELGEVVPSMEAKRALIPSPESGCPTSLSAMFQITFFKCGGVCLNAAFHRAALDGSSMINFMKTWCDIARGSTTSTTMISAPPFLDRTVLGSRLPKIAVRDEPPPKDVGGTSIVTSVLKFSKFHVDKLKRLAGDGSDDKRVSTFTAVAAHVWRCACRARGLSDGVETRMYLPMNFRHRISPPLPPDCFGHAIFHASVGAKVDQGFINSVGVGAACIQETLAKVRFEEEEEHVKPSWQLEKNEIWITSWLAIPLHELDFGYGKPTFTVVGKGSFPGTFYLLRGSAGGVNVVASFEPETMPLFEKIVFEDLEGRPWSQEKDRKKILGRL